MTKIFPQNNKLRAVFFIRINCITGNKMSSKIRAKQIIGKYEENGTFAEEKKIGYPLTP